MFPFLFRCLLPHTCAFQTLWIKALVPWGPDQNPRRVKSQGNPPLFENRPFIIRGEVLEGGDVSVEAAEPCRDPKCRWNLLPENCQTPWDVLFLKLNELETSSSKSELLQTQEQHFSQAFPAVCMSRRPVCQSLLPQVFGVGG